LNHSAEPASWSAPPRGGQQARTNSPARGAQPRTLVVLGGGAAGYFAAIRAAECAPDARVLLLEATRSPLQKVRISGGGRCNVTHNQFNPRVLVRHYPRGAKELLGVLARFGPREIVAWFDQHGVALKSEDDGRMFPVTDDSQSIIDALEQAASTAGVEVVLGDSISTAEAVDAGGFTLRLRSGVTLHADALTLATGSNPQGWRLAESLGHDLVPAVPSLFTFEVADARIEGLSGLSVPHVRARLEAAGQRFEQEGPLLITHWGFSAHAVLRLSAWGARAMHEAGYQATLVVDLVPEMNEEALREALAAGRLDWPRTLVVTRTPVATIPKRLWARLATVCGVDPDTVWSQLPKAAANRLVDEIKRGRYQVQGRRAFADEFVTAGGVQRSDIVWQRMASRRCPDLYFAGEIIDVDGVTGGFNFTNAWATGYLSGEAMAEGPPAQK